MQRCSILATPLPTVEFYGACEFSVRFLVFRRWYVGKSLELSTTRASGASDVHRSIGSDRLAEAYQEYVRLISPLSEWKCGETRPS